MTTWSPGRAASPGADSGVVCLRNFGAAGFARGGAERGFAAAGREVFAGACVFFAAGDVAFRAGVPVVLRDRGAWDLRVSSFFAIYLWGRVHGTHAKP